MKYKYDLIFIIGLAVVAGLIILMNWQLFLNQGFYLLCLSSYFIGKYVRGLEKKEE